MSFSLHAQPPSPCLLSLLLFLLLFWYLTVQSIYVAESGSSLVTVKCARIVNFAAMAAMKIDVPQAVSQLKQKQQQGGGGGSAPG